MRNKVLRYKTKKDVQVFRKILELEMSFYNTLFNTDYSFYECLDAHNMALNDILNENKCFSFDENYLNRIAL